MLAATGRRFVGALRTTSTRSFSAPRRLWLKTVPLLKATEETVAPYGNLFSDFDAEPCRIERWPAPGWRPVEDGVSGGVTEGDFSLEWRDGAHHASEQYARENSVDCAASASMCGESTSCTP